MEISTYLLQYVRTGHSPVTAYETTNGIFELNRSTGGGVTRTWRSLGEESNYGGNIDVEYKFKGIKTIRFQIESGFLRGDERAGF